MANKLLKVVDYPASPQGQARSTTAEANKLTKVVGHKLYNSGSFLLCLCCVLPALVALRGDQQGFIGKSNKGRESCFKRRIHKPHPFLVSLKRRNKGVDKIEKLFQSFSPIENSDSGLKPFFWVSVTSTP